MNIDHFKGQHVRIMAGIDTLRRLSHQGIEDRAGDIADQLSALSKVVTQHLAIEDRVLYPSVERGTDANLAAMSHAYQDDMKGIATAFIGFARHWSDPTRIALQPEVFRAEANTVLKSVHQRIVRENHEFYPAIEAMGGKVVSA